LLLLKKNKTMKHIYPLLTSLAALLLCTTASAQITLLETDMPQIGDQIVRRIDSIPSYGPGNAGANQNWDFSGAVNEFTTTANILNVASTPYSSTFASSDQAIEGDGNSFLFVNQSATDVVVDGVAGDLLQTGELIEAPFTSSLTLHEFPRTYESSFIDGYGFIAEVDGSGFVPSVYRVRLIHTGTVYDTTDGYGTLITPTGTYDALRVKSTTYANNITEFKFLAFSPWTEFTNEPDTSISYAWYAKMGKLAIAEYTYDSLGNPGRFVYSTVPPEVNVGIVSNENSSETFLYPLPANNQVCIGGGGLSAGINTAEIFNVEGKMVSRENIRNNCVDTKGIKNGLYLLRIKNAKGIYLEPKKLIVQH